MKELLSLTGSVLMRARRTSTHRKFTGVAYNGGIMHPSIEQHGQETQSPLVLDLDSLTIPDQIRPVFDNHDETTEGTIGQTTRIGVNYENYSLPVRGILYTEKERSQKIISASDGGHVWQLSVGVEFRKEVIPVGQQVFVNGQTFTGPLIVARNGYLTDISFVGSGGDDTTWASIDARRGGRATHQSRRGLGPTDATRRKRLAASFVDVGMSPSCASDLAAEAMALARLSAVQVHAPWILGES